MFYRDAKTGTMVATAQRNAFATKRGPFVATKMVVYASVDWVTTVSTAVSDVRTDARTTCVISLGNVPWVVLLGGMGHNVMEGAVTV